MECSNLTELGGDDDGEEEDEDPEDDEVKASMWRGG